MLFLVQSLLCANLVFAVWSMPGLDWDKLDDDTERSIWMYVI